MPNERKEWWEMPETMQTDASRQCDVRQIRHTISREIFNARGFGGEHA